MALPIFSSCCTPALDQINPGAKQPGQGPAAKKSYIRRASGNVRVKVPLRFTPPQRVIRTPPNQTSTNDENRYNRIVWNRTVSEDGKRKEKLKSDEYAKVNSDGLHQDSVNNEMKSSTEGDLLPRKVKSESGLDQLNESSFDKGETKRNKSDHLSKMELNELYRHRAATTGNWIVPRKGRLSLTRRPSRCQGREKSKTVHGRRRSSNIPVNGSIISSMCIGNRRLSVKDFIGTKISC